MPLSVAPRESCAEAVKENRRSQVTKGRALPKMDMYLRNRREERILLRAGSVRARVEMKRFVCRSCTPVLAADGPLGRPARRVEASTSVSMEWQAGEKSQRRQIKTQIETHKPAENKGLTLTA